MDVYNSTNYLKAKGTTMKAIIDVGCLASEEVKDCVIADIKLGLGYTVKDIDNDNPDMFAWCKNFTYSGRPHAVQEATLVEEMNLIADLIRVKGVFRLSEFMRVAKGWNSVGRGQCPF